MVGWVGRNKAVVRVAVALSCVLTVLYSYGFQRWWPGDCPGFNTDLQRSLTLDGAVEVARGCPHVTATSVQETLVVDTAFPFMYGVFLAGSLLLLAASGRLPRRVDRAAALIGQGAMAGALLDLTLENPSIYVVTMLDWPPSATGPTEALLLVAGAAAWVKAGLLGLALVAVLVLPLVAAVRGRAAPVDPEVHRAARGRAQEETTS